MTVMPENVIFSFAVEPLTTILTLFNRLSVIVSVFVLCTYVALARNNSNLTIVRG